MLALLLLAAGLPLAQSSAEEPNRALMVAIRSTYVPAIDFYQGTTRKAQVEMRLSQGTGLLFKNLDSDDHTVVSGEIYVHGASGDGKFTSEPNSIRQNDPVIVPGIEFLPPGRYPFFCDIHAGLPSGVLIIS